MKRDAAELRAFLLRHGLGADQVGALTEEVSVRGAYAESSRARIERAVEVLLRDEEIDDAETRAVVSVLEEAFSEDVSAAIPRPEAASAPAAIPSGERHPLRTAFAISLFLVAGWFVVGGVVGGYSRLVASPFAALALLLALIAVLGVYEGLQISVTLLRLKDLAALRDRYARAASLHRLFRAEEGTRAFLAGRQLVVVIVVFFAAQLTSFPTLRSIPGTPWALGGPELLWNVLLGQGVLGALVILWFGQLSPQFTCNRRPVWFLNLPGMGLALRLAIGVDKVGLTAPGEWLVGLVKSRDDVPMSRRERYAEGTTNEFGYGSLGVVRKWKIGPDAAELSYRNSILLAKGGFYRVLDDGLEVRGQEASVEFSYEVIPAVDDGRRVLEVDVIHTDTEQLENGWRRYVNTLEPRIGGFHAGDVLVIRAVATFDKAQGDSVRVTRPTKVVAFSVDFEEPGLNLGEVTRRVDRLDDVAARRLRRPLDAIRVGLGQPGVMRAEAVSVYPEVGTEIIFSWDYSYRVT